MLRLLARILCGLIACLISALIVALVLSNRNDTTLTLQPLPYEITMPIYGVIALSFLLGLSIGIILYITLKLRTSMERRRLRRQIAASRSASKP